MKKIIEKIKGSPFMLFLGRKVAFLFAAILLSLSLVFILPHLMPSNPADIMIARIFGGGGTAMGTSRTPATGGVGGSLEVLREIYLEKFGVKEPLYTQFLDFWKRFLTMDFGLSYWRYPQPVSTLVMYALPWTIVLIIPVLPLGFVIGNWIGSRAAYRRGRFDKILYYISMYLMGAPYYWFALIFMLIFGVKLGWFPLHGAFSSEWAHPILSLDWVLDAAHHYVLPFASLLGLGIGGWAVGMRAMTIYEMESDYMHYSEQLGFTKGKLRKYAEHNAILPNFTWIPLTLAGLVSQTLLVEVIFGYPGIGTLLYNAVFAIDYPLIEACFIMTVLIVLVGNFAADILYGVIDPRIVLGFRREG